MHLLNWVIAVLGTVVMVWFATKYHFSQWGFLGIFFLFALPYGFLWLWLKRRLKLTQLRRQRLLAKGNLGR